MRGAGVLLRSSPATADHTHPTEDETYYVLEGQLTFRCEEHADPATRAWRAARTPQPASADASECRHELADLGVLGRKMGLDLFGLLQDRGGILVGRFGARRRPQPGRSDRR
jgi:hypothetical protein